MKASDLRINNWVIEKSTGKEIRVGAINDISISPLIPNCKVSKAKQVLLYDWIEPIPLTEEWLLKFGSEERNKNMFIYSRFRLTRKEGYKYWHITERGFSTYLTKIEFVHEWQNFVFTMDNQELTNKELEIC